MSPFFSISTRFLNIVLLGTYLFAAVFGIGVHAHQTLSHHHDGIDEHAHDFALHVHKDLGDSNTTPALVEDDHDVPTLQFSGVNNSRSNQKDLAQTSRIVSPATEVFRVHRNDCLVARIIPDASPPLLSCLHSILIGRAPPVA